MLHPQFLQCAFFTDSPPFSAALEFLRSYLLKTHDNEAGVSLGNTVGDFDPVCPNNMPNPTIIVA